MQVESPPQQTDASVDALYSLAVSVKSSSDIHEVYINAHFHYTALKVIKVAFLSCVLNCLLIDVC